MFKNALVSVSDKTGLAEFLNPLVKKGLRVVSTGGTAKYLREHHIPVVDVSEVTGFPEVMDGRVKTLHPKIHMSLLARTWNSQDMELLKSESVEAFDLVIVNLYPFEKSLGSGVEGPALIEQIDIGGPSMLRSASKSFDRITVLCDPEDYSQVSQKTSPELRKKLAAKAFAHVSVYDSLISRTLGEGEILKEFPLGGHWQQSLRYGENPHQKAWWYRIPGEEGLHGARIVQGKELSYNNLLDLDAAWRACSLFSDTTVVAVKHNNPCGVGTGDHLLVATEKALGADPVSVFGGIIAMNRTVTGDVAQKLTEIFLECVLAPGYTAEALEVFSAKKNLRILQGEFQSKSQYQVREVLGGFLVQTHDQVEGIGPSWKFFGKEPSAEFREELEFSWKLCSVLKSNAIAVSFQGQSIGLGMGQVNRVDAVEQAIHRARRHHSKKLESGHCVLSSDGFFPFADSIELAAAAGIKWVVQPGGSIKDKEVIEAAQRLGVHLAFTGQRHFRH